MLNTYHIKEKSDYDSLLKLGLLLILHPELTGDWDEDKPIIDANAKDPEPDLSHINLDIFMVRMKKIGVNLSLGGNYPWIYIDSINGKRVVEKFEANHGFTLGFSPIKKDGVFKFTDLKEIFKIIRKYK